MAVSTLAAITRVNAVHSLLYMVTSLLSVAIVFYVLGAPYIAALQSIPRDYEVEAGDLVPVPSCWTTLRPEWRHFEGAAWYTRDIDWSQGPPGERVILQVGAAAYAALVFLNGVFVGGHRGASRSTGDLASRSRRWFSQKSVSEHTNMRPPQSSVTTSSR